MNESNVFSSTNTEDQVHYVYRQVSKVILNNVELTDEILNLKVRVSMMEEIIYNKLNKTNEPESDTITD